MGGTKTNYLLPTSKENVGFQNFLLLEECSVNPQHQLDAENKDNASVKIVEVNASWCKDKIVNALCSINLSIPQGQFLVIVGEVASGKVRNWKFSII